MRRAAACVLACLLAACASPPNATVPVVVESRAPSAPATATPAPSSADDLVAYLAHLRPMNETALAAEAARQKRDPGDLGHVKAALALSLSAQSDEGEILALVDPIEKRETGDRDVKAMAGFLHVMAVERRRSKESTAARLRDERRVAESQKQRADQLQQKLDGLTDLEKSLSDRPVATDAQAR